MSGTLSREFLRYESRRQPPGFSHRSAYCRPDSRCAAPLQGQGKNDWHLRDLRGFSQLPLSVVNTLTGSATMIASWQNLGTLAYKTTAETDFLQRQFLAIWIPFFLVYEMLLQMETGDLLLDVQCGDLPRSPPPVPPHPVNFARLNTLRPA